MNFKVCRSNFQKSFLIAFVNFSTGLHGGKLIIPATKFTGRKLEGSHDVLIKCRMNQFTEQIQYIN